jgi:hypothetical protein
MALHRFEVARQPLALARIERIAEQEREDEVGGGWIVEETAQSASSIRARPGEDRLGIASQTLGQRGRQLGGISAGRLDGDPLTGAGHEGSEKDEAEEKPRPRDRVAHLDSSAAATLVNTPTLRLLALVP